MKTTGNGTWYRFLFALLAGCAGARDPDVAIFRSLADERAPGHAAAAAAWGDLAPAERLARIRAGIRSGDPAVARVAAALADPLALDLDEIRRAMSICAADPAWVENAEGWGFGIPEMAAIVRTAATTPGFTTVFWGTFGGEFHRALDVSHAEDLVALLETPNDEVAWQIVEWLDQLAANTTRDETRPLFAKAFLYWQARRDAAEAGTPVPPLASIEAKADGPGVPAAVRALLRAEIAGDAAHGGPHFVPWLLRWLFDLEPTPDDVPFLLEVVAARRTSPDYAAWAVRGLASLDPGGSRTGWRSFAEGEDAAAVAAASELARRGDPARLREIQTAGGPGAARAAIHAWETDPEDARRRWIEAAASDSERVDLRPNARAGYELDHGVRIRDEDLEALGRALVAGGEPRPGTAWFFGSVLPETVTPKIAEAMAKRLSGLAEDDYRSTEETYEIETTLACLEVRAPEVVRSLLADWARRFTDWRRTEALEFLARLGDESQIDAMLASWVEWEHQYHLGRVSHPRIAAFLREKVHDSELHIAAWACSALAVASGLPGEFMEELYSCTDEGQTLESVTRAVAARLLANDAEGAVFAMADVDVRPLGSIRTEKTLARLRHVRANRLMDGRPIYWPATAALATAGDADALAEWRAFVRDGRVQMFDALRDESGRVVIARPETAADWIPHLDANCCLAFHAYSALSAAFPTAPIDHNDPIEKARNRVAFERWHARHRGSFVWSRILDGYVPGPAER